MLEDSHGFAMPMKEPRMHAKECSPRRIEEHGEVAKAADHTLGSHQGRGLNGTMSGPRYEAENKTG